MHDLKTLPARPRWLFAAAALFMSLAALTNAPASAQNSIRVLVNNDPITTFDIQQRTKMLSVFTRGAQGEQEAIKQLIDERLMVQEAIKRRIQVTDEEVDKTFAERARAAQLSPQQFAQAIRQAGFDPQTFRDFIQANMAWQKVVRARFRATETVTELDVAAALGDAVPSGEERTAYEYKMQPILFIVPKGAGNSADARQRQQANAFRANFQGCENSLQQIGGRPGIVVQPQVRREESQLPPNMQEQFAKMQVGTATQPERIEQGYQILGMCARTEIAGETESTLEARQKLTSERGSMLARRYLRDLRSDAVIEYR